MIVRLLVNEWTVLFFWRHVGAPLGYGRLTREEFISSGALGGFQLLSLAIEVSKFVFTAMEINFGQSLESPSRHFHSTLF